MAARAIVLFSFIFESPGGSGTGKWLAVVSGVHGINLGRVLLFNQLALELHGGCEFFILGSQLGIEQEEFLDLLYAANFLFTRSSSL
jgi:hypothetical protein